MAENLLIKSHRVGNKTYRENYDRIFKKKKVKKLTVSDNLEDQELMMKNGAEMWVLSKEVGKYEERGWRRLA